MYSFSIICINTNLLFLVNNNNHEINKLKEGLLLYCINALWHDDFIHNKAQPLIIFYHNTALCWFVPVPCDVSRNLLHLSQCRQQKRGFPASHLPYDHRQLTYRSRGVTLVLLLQIQQLRDKTSPKGTFMSILVRVGHPCVHVK